MPGNNNNTLEKVRKEWEYQVKRLIDEKFRNRKYVPENDGEESDATVGGVGEPVRASQLLISKKMMCSINMNKIIKDDNYSNHLLKTYQQYMN